MLEKESSRKLLKTLMVILLVLIADQASKIWIKTHMQLYESIEVTKWFYIYFTENNGMAFGMELFGKLFLSLFRIVAVGFIGYYLYTLIRKNYPFGYIATIALIFAGAMGNIIDSVFYGVLFNHSYGQIATLFPPDGGYSTFLYGKVVDMLYFPLISTTLPEWVPIWGGEEFVFFRPIFNLADSSITIGVFILVLFYRKTMSMSMESHKKQPVNNSPKE